jgi:hypothetical protein
VNEDTGKKVLVFIEHNKYKSVGGGRFIRLYARPSVANQLVATLDTYELPVSGSLQYGQKNDKGEGRFVVYHDNSYKVYQHRFTRAAIETLVLGQAAIQVGIALGYMPEDGTNGVIKNMLSGAENALKVFGEYLHSF